MFVFNPFFLILFNVLSKRGKVISIKPTFTMIKKTIKTVSLMAFALGFTAATLVSCGPKKEEVVEEEAIEEVTPPPAVEEMPADTTMMDSTVVDSLTTN